MLASLPCRLPLLALLFAVLLPAAVPGKEVEVKGLIQKLDVEIGTITIKPYGTAEKAQDLSLAGRDLPITDAGGRPAKVTDLKVGFRGSFRVVDGEEVKAIKLEWPAVWGTLKEIDPDGRTLRLQNATRLVAVKVPQEAQVIVSGRPAPLAGLKAGQPVQVLYAPDGRTVLRVLSGSAVLANDPYRKLTKHAATLLAVDRERLSLDLLRVVSYEPMEREKRPVSRDALVRLMLDSRQVHAGGLDLLGELVRVIYTLDEETGLVEAVDAEMPTYARRKVVSLDAEQGRLTVEDPTRGKRVFELAADVKVLLARGEGKLADIKPGKLVTCGLNADRSKVMMLYVY